MKLFRRLFVGALAALALVTAQAGPAHAILADIIFIIDDSVSMAGDITEVKSRIVQFNTEMNNAGIDAHYGLVRFGGPSNTAGFSENNGRYAAGDKIATMEHQLSDFTTFNDPGGFFQNMTAPTSTQEPGSKGVVVAFDEISFRSGAVKNIILITDEDDDSSAADFALADQLLTENEALFNFIGVPGVNNTDSRYGVLANDHGGQAFDILDFRSDPDPFFENFVNTKVQEIIIAAPEPGALALLGAGLVSLGVIRRMRGQG